MPAAVSVPADGRGRATAREAKLRRRARTSRSKSETAPSARRHAALERHLDLDLRRGARPARRRVYGPTRRPPRRARRTACRAPRDSRDAAGVPLEVERHVPGEAVGKLRAALCEAFGTDQYGLDLRHLFERLGRGATQEHVPEGRAEPSAPRRRAQTAGLPQLSRRMRCHRGQPQAREVPAGTVGRQIFRPQPRRRARKPPGRSASRSRSSPAIERHDVHLSESATGKPSSLSAPRSARALGAGGPPGGDVLRAARVPRAPPATDGGEGAVEKISERAVLTRLRKISALAQPRP